MDKHFLNCSPQKNFADVYVAEIPHNVIIEEVLPNERNEQIKKASCERVKAEKYFVWRLLEHAISKSLGLTVVDAEFFCDQNGKWRSPRCEFSISHTTSAVAVIISHVPVGIDIEEADRVISPSFAKRFLTADEFSEYSLVSDNKKNAFLLTRWCMKEAIFKKLDGKAFAPSKVSSKSENAFDKRIFLGEKEYVIAISCEDMDKVRIFAVQTENLPI